MQEFTLITGHSGVGASKAGRDILWRISSSYLAVKIDGSYVLEEGQVFCTGDDAMIKKLRNELPVLTTVKVLGEKEGCKIKLDKVIETGVKDVEAEKLIAAFNTPVTINDDKLGTLTLNKTIKTFEGYTTYRSKDVSISIDHEDDLPLLHTVMDDIDAIVAKASADAADELLETANDWQNDDNDGDEIVITKADFIARITLESITVSEDSYTLWFDDGDIFFGHVIYSSYDAEGNLLDTTFAG